jgi:hypothetical protein
MDKSEHGIGERWGEQMTKRFFSYRNIIFTVFTILLFQKSSFASCFPTGDGLTPDIISCKELSYVGSGRCTGSTFTHGYIAGEIQYSRSESFLASFQCDGYQFSDTKGRGTIVSPAHDNDPGRNLEVYELAADVLCSDFYKGAPADLSQYALIDITTSSPGKHCYIYPTDIRFYNANRLPYIGNVVYVKTYSDVSACRDNCPHDLAVNFSGIEYYLADYFGRSNQKFYDESSDFQVCLMI